MSPKQGYPGLFDASFNFSNSRLYKYVKQDFFFFFANGDGLYQNKTKQNKTKKD